MLAGLRGTAVFGLLVVLPQCLAFSLDGIPPCGIQCIIKSLAVTSCPLTNETCLCTDEAFTAKAEDCCLANCTVREALVIKNITSTQCGLPYTDNSPMAFTLSLVFIPIQSIFFLARVAAKLMKLTTWGHDDTAIAIAYLSVMGCISTTVLSTRNGLGRNIWALTPDEITAFLQVFFASELLYFFNLAMVKISIVFFYLRVFPGETFRRLLWGTQVFNALLGAAFVSAGLLQCVPMNFFWDRWDGQHEGTCFNLSAMAWSHAAINIALDAWILALPASQIYNMNIAPHKKAQVLLVFGFGVLLTAVSIARLKSLLTFGDSFNVTNDYWPVAVWSKLELTAGLVCACMPAARHVTCRLSSQLFGWPRALPASRGSAPRRSPRRLQKGSRNGSAGTGDGGTQISYTISQLSYTVSDRPSVEAPRSKMGPGPTHIASDDPRGEV